MKIELDAVWRNTGLGVKAATAITVKQPHVEPVTMTINVYSDNGTLVDMTGKTVTFRMTPPVQSGGVIYRVSGTGNTRGEVVLTIAPPKNIQPNTYSWDLFLTNSGSDYQIVPLSAWKILTSTIS